MPTICQFQGISIRMFHRDHPPPHFHAEYAGSAVLIDIRTFAVLRGSVPPRQLGQIVEWAALRQMDLVRAWLQATRGEPIDPIEPLA